MTAIAKARELIAMTPLPAVEHFAADATATGGMPTFDPTKDEALVVGSDVISFGTGVEADFRQAVTDSALFAQLAAQHRVAGSTDPMDFFTAYFELMAGLGWIEQSRETSQLDVAGKGLDVHKAILDVITTFLAPIAGAGAAVLAVLNGLYQMNSSTPFITLFNRSSAKEKIGKFQFTYIRKDPAEGLLANIAAFGVQADQTITQILFFKFTSTKTSMRRSLGLLSIDPATLAGIKPNLAAKVLAYRTAMIEQADLGPV